MSLTSKKTKKQSEIKTVDFDQLDNMTGTLYYTNHLNQFQLGCIKFEVIEDENDGYRSSMREVRIIDTSATIPISNCLGIVSIHKVYEQSFDGYHIIDQIDGHIWLRFGTDNNDDYYPSFIFHFTPKKPS